MLDLRKIAKRAHQLVAPIYSSLYFPPAVIFFAIMAATLYGWQSANTTLDQDLSAAAEARADSAEQALRENMVAYEQILRGGVGLFQSSKEVSLEEWRSFLDALSVRREFQGVQSIGFIKVFDSGELPDVSAFMAQQGINDFRITPAQPDRDQYAALLYIHSVGAAQNPPYGFDAYTEPVRRETMLRSQDSGEITMTPRTSLLPSAGDERFGFSMYAPYYTRNLPTDTKQQRQAALEGYVYVSFLSNEFLDEVIGGNDSDNEGFQVTARSTGETRTMYQSPQYQTISRQAHAEHTENTVELYGQTWTINFVANEAVLVSDEQLSRPLTVLLFGALSAALVSVVVLLLIRARARDLSTQKDQAVEVAKDELLSLASHQLRTPATGVKQYVGMVLQGFAGTIAAPQRKLLEKAYASNDRQLRIINEILHLAKIGSGRIVLSEHPTDLCALVRDIVNEQMPDIKAAKHKTNIKLPKKLAVLADAHMLRMAIENLLSNAIKYTPPGGLISVSVCKDRQNAYITVADSGVGINPDDLDKVFRQFSRLPNEMSQQVGGTGIGLYLTKHLVELHKGTISVKSQPGKGSTFTITLPLNA